MASNGGREGLSQGNSAYRGKRDSHSSKRHTLPFLSDLGGIYLQRLQLERDEGEGREREGDHDQRGRKSHRNNGEDKEKAAACHEVKINHTRLIMTEGRQVLG